MAPRSKPRNNESSGSESDSDAPEAISLSQSKKTIKKLDSSREDAIRAERQSQRMRNQQRDKALKERAERNKEAVQKPAKGKAKAEAKGKGKEVEEQLDSDEEEDSEGSEGSGVSEGDEDLDPNGLEARMLRAMKEAQDEESGSDDEEEFEDFGGVNSDSGDEDEDEDEDEEEEEGNEEDSESEGDDEEEEEVFQPSKKSHKTKFNPDHLPDEIFEAAFASQPSKRTFNDSDTEAPKSASRPAKKRKSSAKSSTPKDIVVGSRAIRVLPSSSHPETPSTMPSRKVKRFVDRTLSLKAGKQRGRGWERRPVNIGVLRRAGGPAANFVRAPT